MFFLALTPPIALKRQFIRLLNLIDLVYWLFGWELDLFSQFFKFQIFYFVVQYSGDIGCQATAIAWNRKPLALPTECIRRAVHIHAATVNVNLTLYFLPTHLAHLTSHVAEWLLWFHYFSLFSTPLPWHSVTAYPPTYS